MAESLTIARPYAEAAFDAARDQGALAAWDDALARLARVAVRPEAQQLFGDPRVPPDQVAALLADVAQGLDAEQRNFVQLLARNERLGVLPQVSELFSRQRNAHEGVLDARVSSAFPLDESQVAELARTLEARYGRRAQVSVEVDPSLIGGVSIRIGDEVMDASVRGKLAQLAAALVQ